MVHTPSVRKRNLPAAQTRRGWLWAAVAGLLVLLGGGLLFRQASESSAPAPFTAVSASPASHSAPADATPKYATKQIRDFRGFEWVLARNPEVADEERSAFDEIDHREWRWVELELTKPDGDLLKVGLGRPLAWLAANQIEPGTTTWLDLPEMGAVGYATVVSVAPCPDPGPKPHPDCGLVTGVFRHSSADCVNVHVTGLDAPIGTTRNHRFWSEDRQTFVEAGQLHPGETLLTADGTPTSVLSIAPRPGLEPVYNLEVDVEHVYYVAADGVLVHNTCGPKRVHLNNNAAKAIFGVYEIKVKDFIYKFGKAHLGRVTRSSGLPTRLHQQVRQLRKVFGKENVSGRVVDNLGETTTQMAKKVEHARILEEFRKSGFVPLGNWKSLKP